MVRVLQWSAAVLAAAALSGVEATRPQRRAKPHAHKEVLPDGTFENVETALTEIGTALKDAEVHGNAGMEAAESWKKNSYAMIMSNKQRLDDATEGAISDLMQAQHETEQGVTGKEGGSVHELLNYAMKTDKRSEHEELATMTKHEANEWHENADVASASQPEQPEQLEPSHHADSSARDESESGKSQQ